jgi:hypothetical protein
VVAWRRTIRRPDRVNRTRILIGCVPSVIARRPSVRPRPRRRSTTGRVWLPVNALAVTGRPRRTTVRRRWRGAEVSVGRANTSTVKLSEKVARAPS